ncbi:hypothetical protein P1S61_34825 [Streptomyces sp. ME08-AFT2]|uniref:hypothetical protein n=1 Tax=Streptomyces sp. ME08-AFT2 TaxID=3028683 RepID=UPI0029BE0A8D|nr:hypothetical protein [Streptomyces sp. ME08-AFT2]MDX3314147.1 hypothetical protein [Streptomyces sp. ME08-AFT2]
MEMTAVLRGGRLPQVLREHGSAGAVTADDEELPPGVPADQDAGTVRPFDHDAGQGVAVR